MISHYQESLFADVPVLASYYCPHPGEKCQGTVMKTRISFLGHLSLVHEEFYTRIQRILLDPARFQNSADIKAFQQIVHVLQTFPTLKLDLKTVPNQYELTDEYEIYKAVENSTILAEKNLTCVQCGLRCKNTDFAILHQFLDHGMNFQHMPRVLKDVGIWLSCQECRFATFSKSLYLSHMGHDHDKFSEIQTRIRTSVLGPIDFQNMLRRTMTIHSTNGTNSPNSKRPRDSPTLQSLDELFYFNSNGLTNYQCNHCNFATTAFQAFTQHVSNQHKLPIIVKCQDCQKTQMLKRLDEIYFKSHRCFIKKANSIERNDAALATLSPAPLEAVFLTVSEEDQLAAKKPRTELRQDSIEDLIEILD